MTHSKNHSPPVSQLESLSENSPKNSGDAEVSAGPENSKKRTSSRQVGRPAGTAPFKEQDYKLLKRAAMAMLDQPTLKLTTALKNLDKNGDLAKKDLARLRVRWSKEGETLFAQAKQRKAANAGLPAWMQFLYGLGWFTERITEILSSRQVQSLVSEISKAQKKKLAQAELGETLKLPFDTADPNAVIAAIKRFEAKRALSSPTDDQALIQRFDENDPDMREGDKLYVMAVCLHELALKAWAEEGHAERNASNGDNGRQTAGSKTVADQNLRKQEPPEFPQRSSLPTSNLDKS